MKAKNALRDLKKMMKEGSSLLGKFQPLNDLKEKKDFKRDPGDDDDD